MIGTNGTRLVTLPQTGQPYDLSPVSGKLVYGSKFPDKGAGPGNLSVTDLWVYDYAGQNHRKTDQSQPVRKEEKVVEAIWGPDGKSLL